MGAISNRGVKSKTMQALYFHQGTIGNCKEQFPVRLDGTALTMVVAGQYCWWGRYNMGNPYYGAYFVSMVLANADSVAPLDDMSTNYGAYAIYKGGKPIRVLLTNSDYYESGTRSRQTFTITGLSSTSVKATRLTGASATGRQDRGGGATIGGRSFQDATCGMQGSEQVEQAETSDGSATFTLAASEALLVYL